LSVSFSELNRCLPYVLTSKYPVLLRGRHGIGKSQVVYQYAEKMDLPVVERRASQMTEGDLLGIPSPESTMINGEEATKFRPFDWLVQACTEPVVLFFDEIDRAIIEVRQGIFELTDSRKLAGWHLHPGTYIVAAINGGEGASTYQVGEMDPAELDRWSVFDIEPSTEDWISWALENSINQNIISFIRENQSYLEFKEEPEPGKVYPSRRSWERFHHVSDAVIEESIEDKGDIEVLYNLTTSFLGSEVAIAFVDYIKTINRQVKVADIVDDGLLEKVSDFSLTEHCNLINKMDDLNVFSESISNEQVANIAAYFVSLPSEAAMKLWCVIGAGEKDNVVRFHKSKVGDKLVSQSLLDMAKISDTKE
jgi:MoxR-like ATPase